MPILWPGRVTPAMRVRDPRTSGAYLVPSNIPGMVVWLDAGAITGLADGAAVTTWADRGPLGYSPSQATASKKPLYKVNLVNGRPGVRFDGVDDFLGFSGAALGMAQNVAGFTCFVVCQTTAPGSLRSLFVASLGTAGNTRRFAIDRENGSAGNYSITTRRLDADAASTLNVAGQLTAGEWAIQAGWRDYANALTALYKNGAVVGGPTAAGTAGSTENTASVATTIGSAADGSSARTNGDIAELIAYGRALSGGELRRVHTYLANKYALRLAA